jgi:hypothetical protein
MIMPKITPVTVVTFLAAIALTPAALGDYICYRIAECYESCDDFWPEYEPCDPDGTCSENPGNVWYCDSANQGPGYDQQFQRAGFVCDDQIFSSPPVPAIATGWYDDECTYDYAFCGEMYECYNTCEEYGPDDWRCQMATAWDVMIQQATIPQANDCDNLLSGS